MDTKSSTEVSTKGNCYLNDDAHNTKMTLQPKENFSAKAQRRAAEKNRSSSLFDLGKEKFLEQNTMECVQKEIDHNEMMLDNIEAELISKRQVCFKR